MGKNLSANTINSNNAKESTIQLQFENIGKFTKIIKDFHINADRDRLWVGKLSDVRKHETNYSVPFSFPEFDPNRITNI